jgi:hypothetical protein
MSTQYQTELIKLRPDDEVTMVSPCNGFDFIHTASHGYLVVPYSHPSYKIACKVHDNSGYGYKTKQAVYLEEDCEAHTFLTTDGAIV